MYRIATIEDNAAEILLLRLALDQAEVRYDLLEFADGESAWQHFAQETTAPDLIVSDAMLPRLDRIEELLQRLKGLDVLKTVPIVVISGLADPSRIEGARASGAADYLIKPSDLAGWLKLGQRLKTTLEMRRRKRKDVSA